jgi:hypothetical protein
MAQQNRFPEAIVLGKGIKTDILKSTTYALAQGEIAMATNENRIYIGDVNYIFKDLMNFVAPHIVTHDGNVVVFNGEVVWVS